MPTSAGENTTSSSVVAPQQILYTVQPGDTLSGIAAAYNVTIEDLAEYNGITDPNSLRPNQELAIPPQPIVADPTAPTDPAAPTEPAAPADPTAPAETTVGG